MYESCDGPELFISFCGVVILALWVIAEAHIALRGWGVPIVLGLAGLVVAWVLVFRPISRIRPWAQAPLLAALVAFGFYRIHALSLHGEDAISGVAFAILAFIVEWIWIYRLKSEIA